MGIDAVIDVQVRFRLLSIPQDLKLPIVNSKFIDEIVSDAMSGTWSYHVG